MSAASKIVRKAAKAKPTPPAGDNALIEARKRARDRQEAKVTPQQGSIATKMTVSKTDIEQAKTANELDKLERRIDEMPDGLRKKMMQDMVKKQRKKFEGMQADEMDKSVRKSAQAARDRSKFKGYTPSSPFNRGGMPSRKGSYDMRKGGMFMKGNK
jgi:hypothetical protein